MSLDWSSLWAALADQDRIANAEGEAHMVERWRRGAQQLDAGEKHESDPLLDFVLSRLDPSMSALDIGAGIGRWTVPLAQKARQVTAVEPLAAMRQILVARMAARDLRNVTVRADTWMEADVVRHDIAIAAHSTYSTTDLLRFVRKMDTVAAHTGYLVLRMPAHDGVIGDLSLRIHGRWHDSPNFVVGYNVLLASGFFANVLVEPRALRPWTDQTIAAALARAKRHLRLTTASHDAVIRETLERRLRLCDGVYLWPDGMRSGLIWWEKV